jgi:hypothetical protein
VSARQNFAGWRLKHLYDLRRQLRVVQVSGTHLYKVRPACEGTISCRCRCREASIRQGVICKTMTRARLSLRDKALRIGQLGKVREWLNIVGDALRTDLMLSEILAPAKKWKLGPDTRCKCGGWSRPIEFGTSRH